MAIDIKKVSQGLYTAKLTLPDVPTVTEEWTSPFPMKVDPLIRELLDRGAHQTDIGDAFKAANPNWMND